MLFNSHSKEYIMDANDKVLSEVIRSIEEKNKGTTPTQNLCIRQNSALFTTKSELLPALKV